MYTGRSMVDLHVLTVHTCSFMCTGHTDLTAHTKPFNELGALSVS